MLSGQCGENYTYLGQGSCTPRYRQASRQAICLKSIVLLISLSSWIHVKNASADNYLLEGKSLPNLPFIVFRQKVSA